MKNLDSNFIYIKLYISFALKKVMLIS